MPGRPVGSQHAGSGTRAEGTGVSNDISASDSGFVGELSKISAYFAKNKEAYQNKRNQNKQDSTDLRIISDIGYHQVRTLEKSTSPNYVFKWVPPRANITIDPFVEGIKFITMHSFGDTYDKARMRGKPVHFSPGSDVTLGPVPSSAGKYRKVKGTGHNAARFAAGIRELTSPDVLADKAVHHLVSLRGDVVNSVSWDNRCIHTGDRAALGIEHEEFYVSDVGDGTGPEYIVDHAPYSLETFIADAFIIKKLQNYTQQTFTRYLGSGTELQNNLRSSVTGCFNHHAVLDEHNDPAAQYYFPPDYRLRQTALNSIDTFREEDLRRWQRWLDRWYPADTYKDGTQISAYATIFGIVGRMRNFDLQAEIFNSALRTGALVVAPKITGSHYMGPLQRAAMDRTLAFNRADQMQGSSRSSYFSSAADASQDSADIWASQTLTLAQITEARASAPIIENALRLDSNTGVWFRTTTRNT